MGVKILGIETSCDETAAAVVEDGTKLLSNVVFSQIDLHQQFGGVVPEVAARSHIEMILPIIETALSEAFDTTPTPASRHSRAGGNQIPDQVRHDGKKITTDYWDQIDAIAVTYGPGLLGSLLIGVLSARTLALIKNKPLYGLNHVEGHTYANFITEASANIKYQISNTKQINKKLNTKNVETKPKNQSTVYRLPSTPPQFPVLSLTVSGGHSQLMLFRGHGDYTLLGQTQDDAAGEAFDKVAKILGLPYPGGPSIAKAAETGDAYKYTFPKAKLDNKYDFSFSGLKTAVLRHCQELLGKDYSFPSFKIAPLLSKRQIVDTAASFQRVAVESLVDKTLAAYSEYQPRNVVIAGGVAANQELRRHLKERLPVAIEYAPPQLCTDNAAMMAALGGFAVQHNQPNDPLHLEINPSLSM